MPWKQASALGEIQSNKEKRRRIPKNAKESPYLRGGTMKSEGRAGCAVLRRTRWTVGPSASEIELSNKEGSLRSMERAFQESQGHSSSTKKKEVRKASPTV